MKLNQLVSKSDPAVGIEIQVAPDHGSATSLCLVCRITWPIPVAPTGDLELGWWLCPRGCNGDLPVGRPRGAKE